MVPQRGTCPPGTPGSSRGGSRAGIGLPLSGRSAPSEPRPARALSLAASPQQGGGHGHPAEAGGQGRRRPGVGDTRQGPRRGLRRAAHLGARQPGQASAMLISLLTKQKPEGVSPRCFQKVSLRKEMLFQHSGSREEGALGMHGPRPRRVTEGLPGAGGGERSSPPPPGAPYRPDLRVISGAARAAPATQCYRFRAAATSGHTCTANS